MQWYVCVNLKYNYILFDNIYVLTHVCMYNVVMHKILIPIGKHKLQYSTSVCTYTHVPISVDKEERDGLVERSTNGVALENE